MRAPARATLLLLGLVALLGGVAACSPLVAINALTARDTYRETEGIAYGPDPRQKLDVYAPTRTALPGAAPVVVFFYGGNWRTGDRVDYRFVGEALASRGILAIVADYRLYPEVRYPGFVEDSARAVAWASSNASLFGGDTKRLYVMGHSAGAYNAAMVALDRRWLQEAGLSTDVLRGWIGLAGPYDFLPVQNPDTRPVFLYPDTPPSSQPAAHSTSGAPRTLLVASRNDSLVDPDRNTAALAKRLRDAGVKVDEIYFEHTTHTTLIGAMSWPLRWLAPVLDTVDNFIAADGASTTGSR